MVSNYLYFVSTCLSVTLLSGSNTWLHCQCETYRGQYTTVLRQSSYCRRWVDSYFSLSPSGSWHFVSDFQFIFFFLWILANRQFRESRLKTVILYNPDLQPSSAFFKLISSIYSLVKMSLHYYTCMGAESELCCAVAGSAVVAVSLRNKWSRITDYFIPCLFLWNMWSCLKSCFDWRYPTSSSHHMRMTQRNNSHADCVVRHCCAKKKKKKKDKISSDWLLTRVMSFHGRPPAVSKFKNLKCDKMSF